MSLWQLFNGVTVSQREMAEYPQCKICFNSAPMLIIIWDYIFVENVTVNS